MEMTQDIVDRVNYIREKGNTRVNADYQELRDIHNGFGLQPTYRGNMCGSCIKKAFSNLQGLIDQFNANK